MYRPVAQSNSLLWPTPQSDWPDWDKTGSDWIAQDAPYNPPNGIHVVEIEGVKVCALQVTWLGAGGIFCLHLLDPPD